jgi:hypothetical protein
MRHSPGRLVCVALALAAVGVRPVLAQGPTGSVSLFADYFPNQQDTTELRARLFAEEKVEKQVGPSRRVRLTVSGFAEGLLSRRLPRQAREALSLSKGPVPPAAPGLHSVHDGILRVQDGNVEVLGQRVDILAGYARLAWGKLDEIQPTDVINPLDVSRFFFEGRSEARLPMLLARARVHIADRVTLEGIYLPDFRRGRYDQLDEPTSPFNLPVNVAQDSAVCLAIACPAAPIPVSDRAPAFTAANAQGGARVSATSGRVDWSVSAFRGFETFGLYMLEDVTALPTVVPPVAVIYPRFTMIGGDFEAVRGKWGLRGEVAAFVDDNFQLPALRVVTGQSFDAGVGVDRRAGDYTLSGTVLVHSESYDWPLASPAPGDAPSDGRTDVSLVVSADRTFAQERYRFRGFGVYNATEASGFVRGIGMASLRDNVALEASIGWFVGKGRDLIGRFSDSDFAYLRVKYYF